MTVTELQRIIVRLVGDIAGYTKPLKEAEEHTKRWEKEVHKSTASVTQAFKVMGAGFAAPVMGGLGVSVKAFSDFDHAMTESQSIMGKLTNEDMKEMRDVAVDLATKWTKSATDMAKSYYFLASAGFTAKESIALLPAMERFAVAGAFDMAEATSLAADAQSALGLKSGDAEQKLANLVRVTDVLVKANTLANANVRQFSKSLTTQAGAALKSVGKDIEEGTAVLAAFADQGVKAELAGTNLARFIRILSQTMVKNGKIQKQLGFDAFDATGNMKNMADIVEQLENILTPMSDEMKAATLKVMGFDARLQQSILPLLGTSQKIREYEEELRKAGGTTQEVANKQMKSFHNQMMRLWNQIGVVAIELGEILAPALRAVAEVLGEGIKLFRSLDPLVKTMIVLTLGLAAAFITLTVGIIIAGKVFNFMFGGIGILVGVLVTGIALLSGTIAGVVVSLGGVEKVMERVKKAGEAAWKWLKPVRQALASFFEELWYTALGVFNNIVDAVEQAWDWIVERTGLDWEVVQEYIVDAILFAEYALHNLEEVAQLTWVGIKLQAIRAFIAIATLAGDILIAPFVLQLKFVSAAWSSLLKFMVNAWINANTFIIRNASFAFDLVSRIWKGKVKDVDEEMKKSEGFDLNEWIYKTLEPLDFAGKEREILAEFNKLKDKTSQSFEDFRAEKMLEFSKTGLIPPDSVKKTIAAAGKTGEGAGKFFNQAFKSEIGKFDAVAFGSAEAFGRIAEQMNMLGKVGKIGAILGGGGPDVKRFDAAAFGGAEAMGRKDEVVAVLKEIRDGVKERGKGLDIKVGADIATA